MSEEAERDPGLDEAEDGELSPEESVRARHRKEKKELLAQITSLKKSVGGNKAKKKAVAAQIEQMEKELQDRHSKELQDVQQQQQQQGDAVEATTEALSKTSLDEAAAAPEEDGAAEVRVSKAQKRRDKKKQRELERLEEIERQEEANRKGARAVEAGKIARLLADRGLRPVDIPSDGDCMFAGLAHQISSVGAGGGNGDASVGALREAAASVMGDNSDEYRPFLTDPRTGDALDEAGFQKYLTDLRSTKAWGGQLELRALSWHLQRPIEVIQAEGVPVLVGEEFADKAKLVLTYHRHMYGLGEHYNSTAKMA